MENLQNITPEHLDTLASNAGHIAVELSAMTDDELIILTAKEIGREYEQDRAIFGTLMT